MPFIIRKGVGRKIARSCKRKIKGRVTELEDDELDFALVGLPTTSQYDEWIMYFGCTYHMCTHKKWFFTFEELDDGVVYTCNDDAYRTTRVGSIKLKNHDGSTRVLTDVWYVLKMKKNLISLGALERKGFIVSMRDGIVKVISGSLVVMKGTRRNNLYYYNGSTVIGSTATVFEKDEDSKITRLWHIHLGQQVKMPSVV